jgi:6-pyruvoyltetrahydropterin/6-carboxytetrahydropterin synthase
MFTTTKEMTFEAAHRLEEHDADCRYVHGHSYRLQVEVTRMSGTLQDGMVVDFSDLKKAMKSVVDQYDHSLILDVNDPLHDVLQALNFQSRLRETVFKIKSVPFRPTAENMAYNFAKLIDEMLPEGTVIVSVKLWETANSFAEWRRS